MKMLSEKEFQSLKISQYEDIPKVMDMECPECHKSDAGGFLHDRSKPVFWCDTPSGFMCVCLNVHIVSLSSDVTSVRQEDTIWIDSLVIFRWFIFWLIILSKGLKS